MSPALDMPLNRREAVASLLAMLAFVLGTGDRDVAAVDWSGDGGDLNDSEGWSEGPCPSSSLNWAATMELCAHDDHLPVPRVLDVEATFAFDGTKLFLEMEVPPDPVWVNGVEQPGIKLGSFVFTGNPVAFLDEISSDADAAWLKEQLQWAEKPYTFCPDCLGGAPEKRTCKRCNGAGWLTLTHEEALQRVRDERASRQAKIDAAWDATEADTIR